jgi:hypothetical protein
MEMDFFGFRQRSSRPPEQAIFNTDNSLTLYYNGTPYLAPDLSGLQHVPPLASSLFYYGQSPWGFTNT